jgi:hypothetical protein
MNDTHTPEGEMTPNPAGANHPIDELAALDPADAPGAAEQYAASLAAELEDAGAAAPDPVQLEADLGDVTDSEQQ